MAESLNAPAEETVVLRPGKQYKAEVRIEVRDGRRILVKDYSACGLGFRLVMGRWLAKREGEALRAGDGIPGVPPFEGFPKPNALAYAFIEGRPIAELAPDELPAGIWDALERLIKALHERGVAHGDLKTLENILVAEDGSPHLVDFTAAFIRRVSPLHALIYRHVSQDDLRAIVKAKLLLDPDAVTEEEQEFYEYRSGMERFFRRVRKPFRAFFKWLGGGKKGEKQPRPSVRRKRDAKGQVRGDAAQRDRGEEK